MPMDAREGVEFPGAGVIGNCEMLDVDAGN